MDPPLLASLGFCILDENRYPASWNRATERDIVGGGGVYAVAGALVVAGNALAPRVAGIVDMGHDFPESVRQQLVSWNSGMVFRRDARRATTRGANVYGEDNVRRFLFLSPKRPLGAEDVLGSPRLSLARSYHLCCTAERAHLVMTQITASRPRNVPAYCLEPTPPECVPANRDALMALIPRLMVFSPNLEEACAILDLPAHGASPALVAAVYAAHLALPKSAVVLRCGDKGCYVHTAAGETYALPAYHTSQANVVDVTGGGNLFCGAYTAGHVLSGGDVKVAAICGILALGAVVEVLGVPTRAEGDRWNGLTLKQRFDVYVAANPHLNVAETQLTWLDC